MERCPSSPSSSSSASPIVYLIVDPSALNLLNNTTPVIQSAEGDPWFWVVFSFIIGLVEELIFRGWIFGYWLLKDPNRWAIHATWTSVLFAGVHLYYGQTYGAAAPLVFPSLFLLGFAFAATMRASGGNVMVVGILHGANDAVAFYSIVSENVALALHYGIILIGALIGLILYLHSRPANAAPPMWGSGPPVSGYRPSNPYAVLSPPGAAPPAPPPPVPPARRRRIPRCGPGLRPSRRRDLGPSRSRTARTRTSDGRRGPPPGRGASGATSSGGSPGPPGRR